MSRCIELAKKALGNTYPNPMVGCVIVYQNKIVAEGWHQKAGKEHAEVIAINALKDNCIIKDCTLYVSLEPCSHFGKTPPCVDLILQKGFKKIVIGTIDPFAKVKGKGIKRLLENGCQVVLGVLEKQCIDLNKRFITYHTKQRPYIILKWATSADGYLSPYTLQNFNADKPVWLTNSNSKQLVHKWRNEEQAILIGTNTAIMDNPSLTNRLWNGKNPLRVVIDKNLSIPKDYKIFSTDAKTLVFTSLEASSQSNTNLTYCTIDFRLSILSQILNTLYNKKIQSVIVEGGLFTLNTFIKENLWDEARVFLSTKKLGKGTPSPQLIQKPVRSQHMYEDKLFWYYNT